MPNCIYKIVRKSDNALIYVGSSRNMACREMGHRKFTETATTRKAYALIREHGGWENHSLECLEETEKSGTELLWLERKYYDDLKPLGNMKRPICTEEERKENEEKKKWKIIQYKNAKNQTTV